MCSKTYKSESRYLSHKSRCENIKKGYTTDGGYTRNYRNRSVASSISERSSERSNELIIINLKKDKSILKNEVKKITKRSNLYKDEMDKNNDYFKEQIENLTDERIHMLDETEELREENKILIQTNLDDQNKLRKKYAKKMAKLKMTQVDVNLDNTTKKQVESLTKQNTTLKLDIDNLQQEKEKIFIDQQVTYSENREKLNLSNRNIDNLKSQLKEAGNKCNSLNIEIKDIHSQYQYKIQNTIKEQETKFLSINENEKDEICCNYNSKIEEIVNNHKKEIKNISVTCEEKLKQKHDEHLNLLKPQKREILRLKNQIDEIHEIKTIESDNNVKKIEKCNDKVRDLTDIINNNRNNVSNCEQLYKNEIKTLKIDFKGQISLLDNDVEGYQEKISDMLKNKREMMKDWTSQLLEREDNIKKLKSNLQKTENLKDECEKTIVSSEKSNMLKYNQQKKHINDITMELNNIRVDTCKSSSISDGKIDDLQMKIKKLENIIKLRNQTINNINSNKTLESDIQNKNELDYLNQELKQAKIVYKTNMDIIKKIGKENVKISKRCLSLEAKSRGVDAEIKEKNDMLEEKLKNTTNSKNVLSTKIKEYELVVNIKLKDSKKSIGEKDKLITELKTSNFSYKEKLLKNESTLNQTTHSVNIKLKDGQKSIEEKDKLIAELKTSNFSYKEKLLKTELTLNQTTHSAKDQNSELTKERLVDKDKIKGLTTLVSTFQKNRKF